MPEPALDRYDAFLSYRHVDPDRRWAKWLHAALESFRTPRALVEKGVRPRIQRVFRDEDELPASAHLSDEIDAALEQSRFLIVVCSPRTPESEWVGQEVVRFRELGRHDRILALLVEGDPATSFPVALREIRTEIADEHGETIEAIEDVEPLAADVRASRGEPRSFLKRMALLRISAALLGCRFDELRRRDLERRRRRWITIGALSTTLAVALAGLSIFAFSERNRAESERDAKGKALIEKTRALDEVERLADAKIVRDLVWKADELWPLHPDTASAMDDWIQRTKAVLGSRPLHEEVRETVRARALPYTPDDRKADETEDRAILAQLRDVIDQLLARQGELAGRDDEAATLERKTTAEKIRKGQAAVELHEERLKERRTWRFADSTDEWKHHVLSDLLEHMERLAPTAGESGLLVQIENRLASVTTLRDRSIDDFASEWRRAIEGVASSPTYDGLEIVPQLGLVPLGPDPDSGLLEFAHMGSGSLPVRDPDTRRLQLSEDSGIVLVLVPGGTFLIGAQTTDATKPNFDPEAEDDETPPAEVSLAPFFLSKFECTQAQWSAMTGGLTPSTFKSGQMLGSRTITQRNPVEHVSWEDCATWLARHRLTLPRESEWEYGCRAGTTTPWFTGADVLSLQGAANVCDASCKAGGGSPAWRYEERITDGHGVHAPVGSFRANAFGLHDTHGNVWEWCQDLHDPRYSDMRILRGGAWQQVPSYARSSNVDRFQPVHRGSTTGVRPAARIASD